MHFFPFETCLTCCLLLFVVHYAGIEEGFIKKRRQRSSLHAVWWTEMLKFLAALANLPQDDLKNI